MGAFIVTSGFVAGGLMRRLLDGHPLLRDRAIKIWAATSGSGATSLAREILMNQREPVIVVRDADTLSPDLMAEQRGWVQLLLERVAPPSEWRILQIAPEVAVLLFRDESLLRSLVPVSPSFEQLIRGRYEPNRVLAELFAQAGGQPFPEPLLERLKQADVSSLWAAPELRPLEEFLLEKSAAQQPGTAP
ncbi:hypothetical protein [Archangium lipolyticum]|uniref:hypothetical protein n=1 Tax=Archangium lipolyticum TaxID=2970465 RepID=UPI002149E41C|nr:hypothetical protein [Archangium lipolyticum]